MTPWEDYLKTIYYDPAHPASFSGPQKLYRVVKNEGKFSIGIYKIRKFLHNQESYSLHKPVRRRFKQNHVISAGKDDLWMADLIDMVKYEKWNDEYKYILVVIDTFSKYVWLRPLKQKTGLAVTDAFEDIFRTSGRSPAKLMTDKVSDACRKDASCRGYWTEVEQQQQCKSEEATKEKFMGKKSRTVTKTCDQPLKVETCCAGYSGQTCGIKDSNDLLTESEVESIKQQLIIDEGEEDKIYPFGREKKFGIGHVIKKEEPEFKMADGTSVTKERIQESFDSDLHIAASDVIKHVSQQAKTWPEEAKESIVNVMFNMKIDEFRKTPGLVASLKRKHWHNAADKLAASDWYKQVKTRGTRIVEALNKLEVIIEADTGDDTKGEFTQWSELSDCTTTCKRGDVKFDRFRTRSCKSGVCDGPIRETDGTCPVVENVNGDKDYMCNCKSGTCQTVTSSTPCASGLTESGLCLSNTASTYKCCLPAAKKMDCTNDWAQDYACKIRDATRTGQIILLEMDGHSNKYPAPKQNIEDACNRKSATRSYYADSSCASPGAPGGEICLTASLLKYIYDTSSIVHGIPCQSTFQVTSVAGSNHGCTSYHYKGKSVDLRGRNVSDGNRTKVKSLCHDTGGVFIYYDTGANPTFHFHCTVAKPSSVTSKDPDSPCENINGVCQENTIPCVEEYKSGLCGGIGNRQCCVWNK